MLLSGFIEIPIQIIRYKYYSSSCESFISLHTMQATYIIIHTFQPNCLLFHSYVMELFTKKQKRKGVILNT